MKDNQIFQYIRNNTQREDHKKNADVDAKKHKGVPPTCVLKGKGKQCLPLNASGDCKRAKV